MNQSIVRCPLSGTLARRLGVLVALAATIAAPTLAIGQAPRPNVVVILTDDATNEAFGFNSALYAHPTQYETP
ncbi:MAG TPA: hypothetical protein VHK01_11705, partial [Lacipirellulaceae bacterium]|nr:hypothetical protein [Lacipirellulaceae bacterium]